MDTLFSSDSYWEDPILRPRLTIPRSTLYIDGLISRIEVEVANCGNRAGNAVPDTDLFEEWWGDQIDILSMDWEEAHHA